jgi:hypothetical protein
MGVPGFFAVRVAVHRVVRAMADAPAVIGHEQRRMAYVADQRIQPPIAGKGPVAAVMADYEQRPEHRTLQDRVNRPEPIGVDARRGPDQGADDQAVEGHIIEGFP